MKKLVMKHERGAKLNGWYIWDAQENRVVKGKITKEEALNILYPDREEKKLALRKKISG